MTNILDFLINNMTIIITVGTALLALAVAIVRITPSKSDDKIVDVILRGFELFKKNVKVEDLQKIKDTIEKK